MKKPIYSLILICCLPCSVYAQSGNTNAQQKYIEQQQQAFRNYARATNENFKKYKDSLNTVYSNYLAQEWKRFELFKPNPLIKNPIPKPPVYDPNTPKPEPEKVPVIGEPKPVKPEPKPQPEPEPTPEPKPEPKPEPPKEDVLKASFYGTNIKLKPTKQNAHLADVTEKSVANYWAALSKCSYTDWTNDAQRLQNELNLNDWGTCQLLNSLFKAYFPTSNANEQVVFNVFVLNQLGYRAKIGRNANQLFVLAAFEEDVFNTSYFIFGDKVRYYLINPTHKAISNVQTCAVNYGGSKSNIRLSLSEQPHLSVQTRTKNLTFSGKSYPISYNQNLLDFYDTYPLAYFTVFAEASIDNTAWQSVLSQIKPNVSNKSQEEAVNWLLYFVQSAFQYKTDEDNQGYEKWSFAEETLASAYSDCDDRAILFSQLVRHLLGMKVVLLYYPGIHLATAVKFNNTQTNGDYLTVDGQKYIVCDPTYVGANLGMGMPDLRSVAVEVIKLK